MRAEFDGAAYDRWLERESDRYWGGAEEEPDDGSLEMEEETVAEARARMTAEEAAADAAWEKGQR